MNADRIEVITFNDVLVDVRMTSGLMVYLEEDEARALFGALGIDFESARAVAAEARAKRAGADQGELSD